VKDKYPEVFRILDRGGDGRPVRPPLSTKLKPRIDMAKASTIFPSEDDPGAKAKEIRAWLANKGVRDFEPVPLRCEHLDKVRSRLSECERDTNEPPECSQGN
jgi:hypothetical protein